MTKSFSELSERPLFIIQVPNERGTMMNFTSAVIPMGAAYKRFKLTPEEFDNLKSLQLSLTTGYLYKYYPGLVSYMEACLQEVSGFTNFQAHLQCGPNFAIILSGICSMHGCDRETGMSYFIAEFLQAWIERLASEDEDTKLLQQASDRAWSRFEAEMKKIKNSQQLFRSHRSVKSFCGKLDKAREILAELSHESRMPHTLSDSERRLLDSTVSLLKTISGETQDWANKKWPNNQAKNN